MSAAPDRNLALELVRVTEAAALAASGWVGRGQKKKADGAAVDAMRLVLDTVRMNGVSTTSTLTVTPTPLTHRPRRPLRSSPPERHTGTAVTKFHDQRECAQSWRSMM